MNEMIIENRNRNFNFCCSEYIDYHGNAYAGVIKMDTKVHNNGDAGKEPIPKTHKHLQIQKFTKENVEYHPRYDLDSNF